MCVLAVLTGQVEPELFIEIKIKDNMSESDQIRDNWWEGCTRDQTVQTLLQRVAQRAGESVQNVRLVHGGKVLHGNAKLGSIAKNAEATRVHLTLEQSGGGLTKGATTC